MQLQESFNDLYLHEYRSRDGEVCKISFLISTYNRAPFVEACVKRLLSIQTSYSIEVIVRDNASEDNTKSVIEGINDPRLRYVRASRNQGTISFLEVGRLARGEIITWLSDEDDFEYQHLDYIISMFKNDPDCSVIIGSVTVGPNSAQVIFPERIIDDAADALVSTLQFSGCGGVFIRGELFKRNCDIHLADLDEAYKTWNYYPIGFFATACFEQKMITTSKIVIRQMRQAPTTDNWSDVGNRSATPISLYPHYYPESIYDRLCTSLVTVFKRKSFPLWGKLKISVRLAASFKNQIDALFHPVLIKLLSDNYSKSSVDAYQSHVQRKNLHIFFVRKLWIVYRLMRIPLRLIFFRVHSKYNFLSQYLFRADK